MSGLTFRPVPEDIGDWLAYDAGTGRLIWKRAVGSRSAGSVAGTNAIHRGQRRTAIKLHGQEILAHRIVWFLCESEQPHFIIDHADGNGWNNARANLRRATTSLNAANCKARRRALPKGVMQTKSGRYRATIMVDLKQISLGTHSTPDLAHAAYVAAACKHFGEFARAA